MKKLILIVALAIVATSVFAAGRDVVVLYHGRSQVNSETLKDLQAAFRRASISMDVKTSGASIAPGSYDAVIVLSTGYSSGMDPELQSFIDTYAAPQEIILLSLQADTSEVFVEVTHGTDSQYGVDAVTSSSTWPERRFGGSGNDLMAMHEEWVGDVVSLVNEMRA